MDKKTALEINALPGWLSLNEGAFLNKAARMVKPLKGTVVEIGSFQGKSTLCLAMERGLVVAVDPHKGTLDGKTRTAPTLSAFKKNISRFHMDPFVRLVRKTSKEAVGEWSSPIKLLFIDGLHDFDNAQFDYNSWAPFVHAGGIVAMHDSFCGWQGAQDVALAHIVENGQYREVGVVGSIIYGIKGRGDAWSRANRARCRLLIRLALRINGMKGLPSFLRFFIIHRLLKALLVNRFTLKRD